MVQIDVKLTYRTCAVNLDRPFVRFIINSPSHNR
jgi:hypothetical protein